MLQRKWHEVSSGRFSSQDRRVFPITLSIVNVNFKSLFSLIYEITCTSGHPATYPKAMPCCRIPKFNNHLPYT